VDELEHRTHLILWLEHREPLLEKVLDRLDVVVRFGLERFDPPRVIEREILHDVPERRPGRGGQGRQTVEAGAGERHEPLDLDLEAKPDEAILTQVWSEGVAATGVTAVYR